MKLVPYLVLFAFSASLSVSAATLRPDSLPKIFQTVECPAVGEEYERMIAKLDAIKTSVKDSANCEPVNLAVKSLEQLLNGDRQKVLELIERGQDTPLTVEESNLISAYAENVTKKVSTLNDLFRGSQQCFSGDVNNEQNLANFANFVGEAAQFAGSVAGPWGTPIAIGGNVIAGFMKGLDQVLKSHNKGYDFSKREQWTNYVMNLCTYYSYRDQIDHLLNPGVRVGELQTLRSELDRQLEIMTANCEECRDIQSTYEAKKRAGPKALASMLKKSITDADEKFIQSVGTYTLQNLGLRDWADEEIGRLQSETASYSNGVTGRNVLYDAKVEIEQFLVEREAPRFLGHQIHRSRQEYQEFLSTLSYEGVPLYLELEQKNRGVFTAPLKNVYWSNELEVFRSLVIQPLNWSILEDGGETEDLQFAWRAYAERSINQLRASESSTQVVQEFCRFFKHAGLYGGELRWVCTGNDFTDLVKVQGGLDQELASSAQVQGLRPSPLLKNDPNEKIATDKVDALIKGVELRGQELTGGLRARL